MTEVGTPAETLANQGLAEQYLHPNRSLYFSCVYGQAVI